MNEDSINNIWCVIPVYNNKDTIKDVAIACRKHLKHVLVIDDGSTDINVAELFLNTDIIVKTHKKNLGKGKAIITALNFIKENNGCFMITIDADGQHYPDDLKKFIPLLIDDTYILVGCRKFDGNNIPNKSKFGRKFANFWLHIETGVTIDDCQSGFRAYPVKYISEIKFSGSHYDFETEVLTKAVWAGINLKTIDIDVWYSEPEKRISGFRPLIDNIRISWMHTKLVTERLLFLKHKKLIQMEEKKIEWNILFHPIKLLKNLLKENSTPAGLAAASAVGIFFGTLPLIATHTIVIVYVAIRLHLNKVMAVSIQNLCMPPFVPALCIELGYFMRYGKWLTEVSMDTLVYHIFDRLYEWFLGSLIIAPIGAIIIGTCVFFISKFLYNRGLKIHGTESK